MHGADAIVLTPYIMRGEVGGGGLIYELAHSVCKYQEATRTEWSRKGGDISDVVWC